MSRASGAWDPLDERATSTLIDRAAAELAAESRAFTRGNLFHATRRLAQSSLRVELAPIERATFEAGPLAARERERSIAGLLPRPRPRKEARLPREWDAYFPAAVLLVDRPAIADLFVASGILVQGRIAVVAVDGTPAHVVDWLRRGLRAGHRAPFGFLHDAATVLYPFHCEPLATWIEVAVEERELPYRDLGLPPRGLVDDRASARSKRPAKMPANILELEELPPWRLVSRAARELLSLVPPDPLIAPLRAERVERRGRAGGRA